MVTLTDTNGQTRSVHLFRPSAINGVCMLRIGRHIVPFKRGLPKTWSTFREYVDTRLPERNKDWTSIREQLLECPVVLRRRLTWAGMPAELSLIEVAKTEPSIKYRLTFTRQIVNPGQERVVSIVVSPKSMRDWKRVSDQLNRKVGWSWRFGPANLTRDEWLEIVLVAFDRSIAQLKQGENSEHDK